MAIPTDETEAIARVSDLELQLLRNAHSELGDILKTAFNWLYPTLVTLNSGALFMLASNIEKLDPDFSGLAGLSFCGGIFFALLVAYRVIRRAAKGRQFLKPLIEQASLRTVGSDKDIDWDSLDKQAKELNRGEAITAVIGWLSFICFVLGLVAIWTGFGIEGQVSRESVKAVSNERNLIEVARPADAAAPSGE